MFDKPVRFFVVPTAFIRGPVDKSMAYPKSCQWVVKVLIDFQDLVSWSPSWLRLCVQWKQRSADGKRMCWYEEKIPESRLSDLPASAVKRL